MPHPQRELTTERLRGESCLGYDPDGDAARCYPVYLNKETDQHTILGPVPPDGHTKLPEVALVEYYGREYEADLCYKRQEKGAVVPGFCWDPSTS